MEPKVIENIAYIIKKSILKLNYVGICMEIWDHDPKKNAYKYTLMASLLYEEYSEKMNIYNSLLYILTEYQVYQEVDQHLLHVVCTWQRLKGNL